MDFITHNLKTIVHLAQNKHIPALVIRMQLKEYLQNYVLQAIYQDKNLQNLTFYGGTALRKLYQLNRMSEDLDFEIDQQINLEQTAQIITQFFHSHQYKNLEYNIQQGAIISRITFKFEILHDLGLSTYKNEKLHVKVEINPQQKGNFDTQVTPFSIDQLSFFIKHYTLEVMMAGKMLACVNRSFHKGQSKISIKARDFYDLIWYMQQSIQPDLKFLQAHDSSPNELFTALDNKIARIKYKDLVTDLQPFFTSAQFIQQWCQNFPQLYKRFRKNY